MPRLHLLLAGMIGSAFIASADVVISPSGNEWSAVYRTDATADIGNNGHAHLDIVGGIDVNGAEFAGGYLQYRPVAAENGLTEDLLFFRFRLDGTKNKMSGAYQVFFETTGDSSVDWVLQLSTSDLETSGLLEFGQADGADRNGVVISTPVWTGSYPDHVDYTGQPTPDGSMFNADADYFLDMALSWDTFSTQTGIQSINSPFRTLMTTSQQGGQILDGDVAGTAERGNVLFQDTYAAIPEPAVASLISAFGLTMLAGRRIFRRS